ncbi:MAG: hypothetical protein KGY99_03990 [Phycisphaerae bacterium]|nr:hypothetical protein [Phycisphaerae bacterium]
MADEALQELRELYVAPNAPGTDEAKCRKYELILAKGRRLEQQHEAAENLHALRSVMLQAAQALSIVDGGAEAREGMLDLAERIATSDAPNAYRLLADLLLTHAEIARHERGAEPARLAIAAFADRYRGTDVEAQSAMRAMILAFDAGDQRLFRALSRRLQDEFGDNPRVVTFLKDRFGVHAGGKTINALLERPEGGTWRLPMDVIGRPTTVTFWATDVEYFDLKIRAVKDAYRHADPDTFLLGINLDTDRDKARRAVKRLGLDFPQVYRGRGADDPVFLLFGKARIPSISYLKPDGTTAESVKERDNLGWACPRDNEPPAPMITFLRSGEFLVTRPVGPTDPAAPPELGPPAHADAAMKALNGPRVPAETLRAIQECFSVPPRRYRLAGPTPDRYDRPSREKIAALYETAVVRCRRALSDHAGAADLFLVRNRLMVALVGLSAIKTDPSLTQRAAEIAEQVLQSDVPDGGKIVADLCATRWRLRDVMDGMTIAEALEAFIDRHGEPGRKPLALVCATMLAMELGQHALRDSFVREVEQSYRHVQGVRPFLWYAEDDRAEGLPLRVDVPLLDGTTLHLPEDWHGRAGAVVFIAYSSDAETLEKRCRHMRHLGLARRWHRGSDRSDGMHVLYVISGATREQAEKLVEQQGWDWPIAFSGPGWRNPLAQAYRGPGPQEGMALLVVAADGTIMADKRGYWLTRNFDRTLKKLAERRKKMQIIAKGTRALEAGRFKDAADIFQEQIEDAGDRRPAPRLCMLLAKAKAGLKQWHQAATWIDQARRYTEDDELLKEIKALQADYATELKKVESGKGAAAFRQPPAVAEAMPGSRLITQWNVVGPFHMTSTEASNHYRSLVTEAELDLGKSWGAPLPPERSVDLSQTYRDKFGNAAKWTQATVDVDGFVSLERLYRADLAAACAVCYVRCPEPGDYAVGIGSDDHHVVRVNGRVVDKHYGPRTAELAEDRFDVHFEEGWNEILVTCGDTYGDWGFYFQIVDADEALRFAPTLPKGAKPVPRSFEQAE